MARTADPTLPGRILAAAHALWTEGGDAAVTLRDVARRAATTTPSVYAYFEDRAAILRGVRGLARGRFEAAIAGSTGVADGCARVLDFVEAHPRDYELLFGYGYRDRVAPDVRAAELALLESHVRQAGVRPLLVRPTALAIASLLHGTAMFRLAQDSSDAVWPEYRRAALAACETLLEAGCVGRRHGNAGRLTS
ncbi:MAG: helix-turn-helix domain-containing protein [Reyranellaceae bacterium]